MKTVVLDIGGTDIKFGICDQDGFTSGSFPVKCSKGILLPDVLEAFIRKNKADRVAVCSPGPFDYRNGISHARHKLPELYNVDLKKILTNAGACDVFFINDCAAFLLGMLSKNLEARIGRSCGVTIGTGLGYIISIDGKLYVDDAEKPMNSLWCAPWKDGICEEYASATAIGRRAALLGYSNVSVKEIASVAQKGDKDILNIFETMGEDLGQMLTERAKTDWFEQIFFGGNVIRSWKLFKSGFERNCKIPYTVTDTPDTTALHGLLRAIEIGKENIYHRNDNESYN